jgi:hypothetical protein
MRSAITSLSVLSWFRGAISCVAACLMLVFAAVGACGRSHAATITFDDVNVPSDYLMVPADQYYFTAGISFSDAITVINVSVGDPTFVSTFVNGGGTLPNALALTPHSPSQALAIEGNLSVPGTSIPAVTNMVQIDGYDSNVGTETGTLTAYDVNGVVVGSMTIMTGTSCHGLFTLSHTGIHRIRIATDSDGALFDNLRFNAPVAVALPGDANQDGTVNIDDLSRVLTNYDKTGMTWTDGDFNGDGTVNINDLSNVLTNYDRTYGAGGVQAVPEPSSIALLAICAFGLLVGSWQRRPR